MAKKLSLKEKVRNRRMKWWRDARFGMFIHWGLYSQLGRHEWVMNRERIPVKEYEKYADTWKVKPRPAREWARLAKQAGMKYMVMTTKHHEGFCLWDSEMTDYNAVKRSPGRDLVQEYVDACREYGLKVGFYYSLMDWHHPDGAKCAKNEKSRRRFIDFTYGCVKELMSNYGKIDILWYDVSWPLSTPEKWESAKMNGMARQLQPNIIINNRSKLPEDFGTPEGHVTAEGAGRDWEACMTYNGSWGYRPSTPPEDWHSNRAVIGMLRTACAGSGNLLLNIGPAPDGSLPPEASPLLKKLGKWTDKHSEAIYGKVDRADSFEWDGVGSWTRKGNTAYWWVGHWAGGELTVGGMKSKLKKATLLETGKRIRFSQNENQIKLKGLPKACPDKVAKVSLIKLEFASKPTQELEEGCVLLKDI